MFKFQLPILQKIQQLCNENNAVFHRRRNSIWFRKSGKFFAHQHAGVTPDIISMAKEWEMVFLLREF